MPHSTTQDQLTALYEKRKRWHTRLVRATNELAKISKSEKRLRGKLAIEEMTAPPGEPTPLQKRLIASHDATVEAKTLEKFIAGGMAAQEAVDKIADDLKVPNFLSRNPDEGTKIAATKKPVDKKAMPLNERDALNYIKAKSDEVTKRRAKKELRLR